MQHYMHYIHTYMHVEMLEFPHLLQAHAVLHFLIKSTPLYAVATVSSLCSWMVPVRLPAAIDAKHTATT